MEFALTPYQIGVPIIAFVTVVYAWSHVLRGTKTIWEGLLWTVFWSGVATIVLFPRWIGYLTTWTGIKDQENAVFAIAIGILLFIVFYILLSIEKLNKRITDLVRHQALKEAGMEKTEEE